jgi:DNA-binding CsgD family transcriptional regulator
MDEMGSIMPSRAWGIYRLDENLVPIDVAARNVPDPFLLRYEEVGRREDPMMAEMIASHVPCHNLTMLSPEQWHRHQLFLHITSRLGGLDHILEAPLLGDGRIIGTLNFGRIANDAPFDHQDLARAGALAHHVSTALARLSAGQPEELGLTAREQEIATLVAAGLTNREIADCLTISRNTVKEALKRIFRKAEVDTRAELAARVTGARRVG